MTENTNPLRGEVEITLGGVKYIMRPSFDALVKMERLTGRGVLKLAARLSEQNIGFEDVAGIVYAGICGNPDNPSITYEKVGEALVKDGLLALLKPAGEFLTGVLQSGSTQGNAERQ